MESCGSPLRWTQPVRKGLHFRWQGRVAPCATRPAAHRHCLSTPGSGSSTVLAPEIGWGPHRFWKCPMTVQKRDPRRRGRLLWCVRPDRTKRLAASESKGDPSFMTFVCASALSASPHRAAHLQSCGGCSLLRMAIYGLPQPSMRSEFL